MIITWKRDQIIGKSFKETESEGTDLVHGERTESALIWKSSRMKDGAIKKKKDRQQLKAEWGVQSQIISHQIIKRLWLFTSCEPCLSVVLDFSFPCVPMVPCFFVLFLFFITLTLIVLRAVFWFWSEPFLVWIKGVAADNKVWPSIWTKTNIIWYSLIKRVSNYILPTPHFCRLK